MIGCGCLDVELSRIRIFQIANVAREFDARGLHSEANAKVRRARFARVGNRANHSFDAALAKAAGYENRVKVTQARFIIVFVHQVFRFDPLDVDPQVVRDAAVRERFAQRLVRIFQLDILADDRDRSFAGRKARESSPTNLRQAVRSVPRRASFNWSDEQSARPDPDREDASGTS